MPTTKNELKISLLLNLNIESAKSPIAVLFDKSKYFQRTFQLYKNKYIFINKQEKRTIL